MGGGKRRRRGEGKQEMADKARKIKSGAVANGLGRSRKKCTEKIIAA
jgi:hypothetical protein